MFDATSGANGSKGDDKAYPQSSMVLYRAMGYLALGIVSWGCGTATFDPAEGPAGAVEAGGDARAGDSGSSLRDRGPSDEAAGDGATGEVDENDADTSLLRGDADAGATLSPRDAGEKPVDRPPSADAAGEHATRDASPGPDASQATDAKAGADSDTGAGTGLVPGIIGVGYGGVRIISRDQGKTWGSRSSFAVDGGDDQNLLRAVAYGKGMWIATGWKLVTSIDGGLTWSDHGMIAKLAEPRPPCNIVEGLTFKDDAFYGACAVGATGAVFRSTDGLGWTKVADIGNTGAHLFLAYAGARFFAYGDTGTTFVSDDAMHWSALAGVDHAVYCGGALKTGAECGDASWFSGVFLKPEWKGKILRSTDGTQFTKVYVDDQDNTLYQGRAFAAGMVAPQ